MRGTLCLLLLAAAASSAVAQDGGRSFVTSYKENVTSVLTDLYEQRTMEGEEEPGYEWEGYDGWYNNPAHPDWGGADMPMERKTPVAYPDGVYEIAGQDRPNVLLIANVTQNGLTGFGSRERTALFIFFGQQVVEEMLDAQRPGCIPEYEDMFVPKCHPLYDSDCRGDRYIPFLRNRHDFGTGYSPNVPRMQLNEITPWIDGGLMYGITKAWADALRSFEKGELVRLNNDNLTLSLPADNTLGLPLANPPPPANHSLFEVNRFWRIGNPRGNENPFLLTMGILWFRVHNFWAERLYTFGQTLPEESHTRELYEDDEWLYNRARQLTIATHQHIVYNEWLPVFIPRKFPNGEITPYARTPGYSLYFGRTGYNPAINPQIAHIFQSAAMRFGHTMVTPGVWRREFANDPNTCSFGSPISPEMEGVNSFIEVINEKLAGIGEDPIRIVSYQDVISNFYTPYAPDGNGIPTDEDGQEIGEIRAIFNIVSATYYENEPAYRDSARPYTYTTENNTHFVPRTCNAYWNPQVPIRATNIHPFFLGMASQRVEREDTIITPDLRGKVFGPLDFSRRDLMAINMQRARDHGLPDFNSARLAYGLPPVVGFEDLNPLYGIDEDVTRSIENLREVYNNDISKCDIWACGLAETVPSDREEFLPYFDDGDDSDVMRKIPAGPGELFTEVLFDQFMRIRHGDRFWYENYEANGILTEEEFYLISNLTIKKLIMLVTPIREEDLSDDPFMYTNQTVCPQPFQLSELYMDDCTSLKSFDYYENDSVWQVPFIWGLAFLYTAIVILIMFLLAAYNQYRREKVKAAGRTRRPKHIEGRDVTTGDGEVLVVYELKAGSKSETRTVSMKFGPGKRLVLFSGDEIYREVDLRHQTQVILRRPFNDDRHFVLRIPHEYDIIIRCHNPLDRTAFIESIQSYMGEIGLTVVIEEPLKKQMLAETYTKRDRQRLLENFFKSVFREGGRNGGEASGEIGETRQDILECELNKEEFADAMSLKKDSLFVEQMFQLIDQDGNGFISFREFLNMIVIFAKGSPEDKIKLMFDMYDVDKSGRLSREEFRKMLKAMMELVNATVSSDQMDGLVDSMFTSAGFQNKEELTLEDFNVLLRDHKEQLSSAHLNIAGVDVDLPEKPGASESEGTSEAVPSRYRARETATARARRTVIRAYGRTTKGDPRGASGAPADQGTDTIPRDIPVQMRRLTKSVYGRYFWIFLRIIENYRLHIFWLSIFFLVTIAIFVERAYYYSVEREVSGLRRIAGYGVTVTRGAASAMMFTYSVLLITMARNFITYLRETIFNNYIPFDSYISFHKIVALTALLFTICHCIGHGINFYHISTQTPGDLTCIFREVYFRTHTLPRFTYWLFLTMTGFSAFILTLVTVVIFVFATQYARRYTYQAFWVTHHFYIAFYILMFLHGSGRLVQDPLFGNFFLGPAIVYALDQIVSVSRRKQELSVIRADILPSLVVGIYFKRPHSFDYKAGQWVKIASSAQNPGEFHSFTISSAPHEDYLSLHIRAVGPWTYNFRDHYNPVNLRGQPYPKVFIDGPFGEGHQDWTSYEVSVLVGGGIGVTPFASILKELVHRFNIGARVECKKVFFIWVTRSQKQWEWFADIIKDVEDADTKGLVETHIFITQFFDKFDLRTAMLYICERHFQKLSGRSLFTGLRAVTHFGRPDFNQFFDSLQEDYVLLPQIGVFSCGPPGMTNGVEAACAATNRFEGPAFLHHYENF